MLNDVARDGNDTHSTAVSWLPNGKAFRIHKPTEFAQFILPRYFDKTKYKSFKRQLNIYGFQRVTDKNSPDFDAYHHTLFQRGMNHLCFNMTRRKRKGSGGISLNHKTREQSPLRLNSKKGDNEQRSNTSILEFRRWGAEASEKKNNRSGSLYNPLEDVPQRGAHKRSVAPCNTGSYGSFDSLGSALLVSTALHKKTNAGYKYQEGDNCFVLAKQRCYDQEQQGVHKPMILVDAQELRDGDASFFAGKRFFFTELS
jgi:hypothetical protein